MRQRQLQRTASKEKMRVAWPLVRGRPQMTEPAAAWAINYCPYAGLINKPTAATRQRGGKKYLTLKVDAMAKCQEQCDGRNMRQQLRPYAGLTTKL